MLDLRAARASWLNLVLPGGGLILQGWIVSGLLIGLAFTACANFALVATLLFPDEFSRNTQALAIGLAAGCYLGAQLRLTFSLRAARSRAAQTERRRVLAETRARMDRGDYAGALELITPLADTWQGDLLVNYRLAQILTAAGAGHAAHAAWERVRTLDRHGIYRQQIRAWEARLERPRPSSGGRGSLLDTDR